MRGREGGGERENLRNADDGVEREREVDRLGGRRNGEGGRAKAKARTQNSRLKIKRTKNPPDELVVQEVGWDDSEHLRETARLTAKRAREIMCCAATGGSGW